ncbi:MAG: CaiB/BaiF CoA-transferase family protein [Armatimonadota bacterium]|nr:CaiB/BaiF CoA-transferase family protein [Armatimonadota bacterium]MDR5704056.1 CaiB/BaiF CoA-transferase family protein [Armatimonadota bacterium]
MSGPLEGIRILDLTRLLPGAFCTMLLADLGADVLKVEEPERGDPLRWLFPQQAPFLHHILNRNKRSLTLNLRTQPGRGIFLRLVREADVLVESFRPGTMDRLGVGYSVLREVNPGLVYCAITGYGQDGPYRDLPGHDLNYMGVAGALELFGTEGSAPAVPGLTIADIGGGAQMAATGILAALISRARTGCGQFVDISMTDGVISWLSVYVAWYLATGRSPRRGEHVLLGRYPCYAVYPTADGYLTVGCLEERFWANLCRALGREEYIDLQWSEEHRKRIFNDLGAIFQTRTRQEWMEFFQDKDVCVGPSSLLEEAIEDPHLRHRGMFVEVKLPQEGSILQVGIPIKFSGTPGSLRSPAPRLGEHTEAILRNLGYSPDEIAKLRREKVV